MTRNVAAIIMAGGAGERLWPLTAKRAKPAVPIAGKFRLIDIPISNCLHSEVNRIFVLTQYMSRSLNQHVAATYHFDPFRGGFVQILAAQQTPESAAWYQGTADAVRRNLQYFDAPSNERFLILAGDHLYSMDFRKLIDWHVRSKAEVTVSAIPVSREVAHRYGILKTNTRGRIIKFVEKPNDPAEVESLRVLAEVLRNFGVQSNGRELIASMGIYVFERQTLFDILNESREEDFGKGIIPYAIKTRRVYAYLFDGYWEDIGTISSFYEAMIDLTRPVPKFNFYTQRAPIFTRPRYLPGAKITSSLIERTILADGSIVEQCEIKDSILGIRSIVRSGTRIYGSIIMGADYYETDQERQAAAAQGIPEIGIGHNCLIERAIIDKNARIGANVQILNRHREGFVKADNFVIRDGILIVPKNAIILPGTIIG
ncbi:MAG: glucose-1-phosphate adenylyltransferase [bacterium]|jgi:glucose-1-phosphate adenylyltransferase|nr:glucose-1-phosphate adenylyltransferase [candidate division KSB1 bacterium]MDH7561257.1 glucose-1-phosphate adenylyltransferase [bacterium]